MITLQYLQPLLLVNVPFPQLGIWSWIRDVNWLQRLRGQRDVFDHGYKGHWRVNVKPNEMISRARRKYKSSILRYREDWEIAFAILVQKSTTLRYLYRGDWEMPFCDTDTCNSIRIELPICIEIPQCISNFSNWTWTCLWTLNWTSNEQFWTELESSLFFWTELYYNKLNWTMNFSLVQVQGNTTI